jgi:hypothetical protein
MTVDRSNAGDSGSACQDRLTRVDGRNKHYATTDNDAVGRKRGAEKLRKGSTKIRRKKMK